MPLQGGWAHMLRDVQVAGCGGGSGVGTPDVLDVGGGGAWRDSHGKTSPKCLRRVFYAHKRLMTFDDRLIGVSFAWLENLLVVESSSDLK